MSKYSIVGVSSHKDVFVCGRKVAEFFDRAVKITTAIKKETGPKIKDFRAALKVRHAPHAYRPTAVSSCLW